MTFFLSWFNRMIHLMFHKVGYKLFTWFSSCTSMLYWSPGWTSVTFSPRRKPRRVMSVFAASSTDGGGPRSCSASPKTGRHWNTWIFHNKMAEFCKYSYIQFGRFLCFHILNPKLQGPCLEPDFSMFIYIITAIQSTQIILYLMCSKWVWMFL